MLLPVVEFNAARGSVCCSRGLSLLLLGFEFAAFSAGKIDCHFKVILYFFLAFFCEFCYKKKIQYRQNYK